MTATPRAVTPDRVILAPVDRRAAVIDVIRSARSHLALSLFRCNDKAIFTELAAAVARGVNVEVLVTSRAKGRKKKQRKLWQRLEATGATIHSYNDQVVKYHAKYVVADDGPALVASLNFTKKCFKRTCDAIVITHDPQVVDGLRQLIATDRDAVAASDTIGDRLILGPERARRQFATLIAEAQSSILIIDAKMSDPDLLALLDERRAAGVIVRVHDADMVGNLKSHGKIMLIDGSRAVVGGLSLTAMSLDFRREVAIVVTHPAAVSEIQDLFRSVGMTAAAPGTVPAAAGGASC